MLPRTAAAPIAAWQRFLARLRPAPIASVPELREFLEARALLIAQKCAIDYCRGKTGLASYALFSEATFLKALDVCRWEGFAAVLADLLVLAEARLRAHAGDARPRLDEALLGLYRAILEATPPPAHRRDGWQEALAAFPARFAAACAAEPQGAVAVAEHSAKRLFDTLPIHSRMRELDQEVVYGAVRFRMVAVHQEMHRRFDAPALARALLA
ncbi:MAG TPA: hypothetical protein VF211_03140 [Burkholderiales bacterium]